jgi:hypothetical protein
MRSEAPGHEVWKSRCTAPPILVRFEVITAASMKKTTIFPPILNFGTRHTWLFSFRPWPHCPGERTPPVPTGYGAGWAPELSGCGDEEKNTYPCWESSPGHTAHSLVTVPAELSWPLSSYLYKLILASDIVISDKQCKLYLPIMYAEYTVMCWVLAHFADQVENQKVPYLSEYNINVSSSQYLQKINCAVYWRS